MYSLKVYTRIFIMSFIKVHLQSKRHGRSVKLLNEGGLKMMLANNGEIERETHRERHASTLAFAQSNKSGSRELKKNKGRQRQRKRLKKKQKGYDDLTSKKRKSRIKRGVKVTSDECRMSLFLRKLRIYYIKFGLRAAPWLPGCVGCYMLLAVF